MIFIVSCGQKKSDSNVQTTAKSIEPQGFVVGDYKVVSDDSACNAGEKGARILVTPINQSKKPFSSITCFVSERVVTDNRRKDDREHLKEFSDPSNETKYSFPNGSVKDFCDENGPDGIKDFGALVYYGDWKRPKNIGRKGYGCDFDPEKVVKMIVINGQNPSGFFDMRALQYFPNLTEIVISTNAIVGTKEFQSPPKLRSLIYYFYGVELEKEIKQAEAIALNLKQLTYAEFDPAPGIAIDSAIDVSFVSQMANLEFFGSSMNLKNLNSLSGLKKLKVMEITRSEDRFAILPENLSMLRFEVDTTSRDNWADQKKFKINSFNFER